MKRTENSWVLPEKQNQIAVVGRTFSSPPLIANRWASRKEKNMCRFCEKVVFVLWKKLQIGQQFRTPDLYKGKDFKIVEKTENQIKIQPQNLVVHREAFAAAIHYLRENNHYMNSPCEIRSSNSAQQAGPLCKTTRNLNNNIRCINYILPIFQKNVIAGVNPVRPNSTWLLIG